MNKTISRKTMVLGLVLALALLSLGVLGFANNARLPRHPNLAAAQAYIEKAIDRVTAAQKANEYDLNGHAAKAKALLDEAYAEIKLAAIAANNR